MNNLNEEQFLDLVKNVYPYYLEIAKQLFPDKNEIINYFKQNTNEKESLIKQVFNCEDNIKNYIHNYTSESFYYKYINKFLREGDFDTFRILSSHLSKFIYNLYLYREKNIEIAKSNLYRKMYLNPEDIKLYKLLIGKVICYPSFTSTSITEEGFVPKKYNENDEMVKLIIEQNDSKGVVSVREFSEFPEEEEYLFLPFSFFKIKRVQLRKGDINNPHIIYMLALTSDKPIEEMFLYFIQNETDNLNPEGLDMLLLSNRNEKIIFNSRFYQNKNKF